MHHKNQHMRIDSPSCLANDSGCKPWHLMAPWRVSSCTALSRCMHAWAAAARRSQPAVCALLGLSLPQLAAPSELRPSSSASGSASPALAATRPPAPPPSFRSVAQDNCNPFKHWTAGSHSSRCKNFHLTSREPNNDEHPARVPNASAHSEARCSCSNSGVSLKQMAGDAPGKPGRWASRLHQPQLPLPARQQKSMCQLRKPLCDVQRLRQHFWEH